MEKNPLVGKKIYSIEVSKNNKLAVNSAFIKWAGAWDKLELLNKPQFSHIIQYHWIIAENLELGIKAICSDVIRRREENNLFLSRVEKTLDIIDYCNNENGIFVSSYEDVAELFKNKDSKKSFFEDFENWCNNNSYIVNINGDYCGSLYGIEQLIEYLQENIDLSDVDLSELENSIYDIIDYN